MLCLPTTATQAEEPPADAVPFSVEQTTTVRAEDGPIYHLDGPTVIPKKAEITVQLDTLVRRAPRVPAFGEVPSACSNGRAAYRVEIEDPAGRRRRVDLPGPGALEGFVRVFLERG